MTSNDYGWCSTCEHFHDPINDSEDICPHDRVLVLQSLHSALAQLAEDLPAPPTFDQRALIYSLVQQRVGQLMHIDVIDAIAETIGITP